MLVALPGSLWLGHFFLGRLHLLEFAEYQGGHRMDLVPEAGVGADRGVIGDHAGQVNIAGHAQKPAP